MTCVRLPSSSQQWLAGSILPATYLSVDILLARVAARLVEMLHSILCGGELDIRDEAGSFESLRLSLFKQLQAKETCFLPDRVDFCVLSRVLEETTGTISLGLRLLVWRRLFLASS